MRGVKTIRKNLTGRQQAVSIKQNYQNYRDRCLVKNEDDPARVEGLKTAVALWMMKDLCDALKIFIQSKSNRQSLGRLSR